MSAVDNLKAWFDKLGDLDKEAVLEFLYKGTPAKVLVKKGMYLGPAPELVDEGLHLGPAPMANCQTQGRCPLCGK